MLLTVCCFTQDLLINFFLVSVTAGLLRLLFGEHRRTESRWTSADRFDLHLQAGQTDRDMAIPALHDAARGVSTRIFRPTYETGRGSLKTAITK